MTEGEVTSRPKGTNTEKRGQIITTALQLFTTQGFHATPTAQISREAGVSTGTLFHHFKDKKTLINEIYLSIKREMAETIKKVDDTDLSDQTRIINGLRAFIQWGLNHPRERAFLELFYHSPDICIEVKEQAYADFLWLEELCRISISKGVIRDIPNSLTFPMIGHLASGIIDIAGSADPGVHVDEIIEAGLSVIWNGIRGPGSTDLDH